MDCWLPYMYWAYLSTVRGFNLDTASVWDIEGDNQHSEFGFDLAFYENSDQKGLLIGSPGANSTNNPGGYGSLDSPGVVYFAPYRGTSKTEVPFDEEGDTVNTSVPYYKWSEYKSGYRLGSTISVSQDGTALACAPKWENRFHASRNLKDFYLLNGACYLGSFPPLRNSQVEKMTPLVYYSYQLDSDRVTHVNSMAQAGFSSHITQDGVILMGAPGYRNWTGTVVHREKDGNVCEFVPQLDDFPNYSYLGYSVDSGSFLLTSETMYVAGAPRHKFIGKVIVYRAKCLGPKVRPLMDIQIRLEGTQVGEYFGASLAALDLNNDDRTDLVVGAPLHKTSSGDEGAVYVFLANRNGNLPGTTLIRLHGSNKRGARFGSAIAKAGDLNADNYPDLIISAPYEENGAVYIYHGTSEGISSSYQQRLTSGGAATYGGFGFAIDGGMDIDDNGYPDVAVGSVFANKVEIFKSLPVVKISSQMTLSDHQINPKSEQKRCKFAGTHRKCVKVEFQYRYDGLNVPSPIDIKVTLKVDTIKLDESRVDILDEVIPNTMQGSTYTFNLSMKKKEVAIKDNIYIVLKQNTRDILTPIALEATYSLLESVTDYVDDKHLAKPLTDQISFTHDCGDDNICLARVDVNIKPTLHPNADDHLIFGQHDQLKYDVTISNSGEDAYLTEFIAKFPPDLRFGGIKQTGVSSITCLPLSFDAEVTKLAAVTCEIGNPMPSNSDVGFDMLFDHRNLHEEILGKNETLDFNFAVTTLSEQLPEARDNVTISLGVKSSFKLVGIGKSDPEQINLKKSSGSYPVRQQFELYNEGPGTLPVAELTMRIPVFHDDHGQFIEINRVEYRKRGRPRGQCNKDGESNDVIDEADGDIDYDGVSQVPRTGAVLSEGGQAPPKHIDCSTGICLTYKCRVEDIRPNDIVTFEAVLVMDLDSFNQSKNVDGFIIKSTGKLLPNDYIKKEYQLEAITLISEFDVGIAVHVSWLTIGISLTVGIILLAIIIGILYWRGFFRRKTREDLKRLIEQEDEHDVAQPLNTEEAADNTQNESADGRVRVPFSRQQTTADNVYDHPPNQQDPNGDVVIYDGKNVTIPRNYNQPVYTNVDKGLFEEENDDVFHNNNTQNGTKPKAVDPKLGLNMGGYVQMGPTNPYLDMNSPRQKKSPNVMFDDDAYAHPPPVAGGSHPLERPDQQIPLNASVGTRTKDALMAGYVEMDPSQKSYVDMASPGQNIAQDQNGVNRSNGQQLPINNLGAGYVDMDPSQLRAKPKQLFDDNAYANPPPMQNEITNGNGQQLPMNTSGAGYVDMNPSQPHYMGVSAKPRQLSFDDNAYANPPPQAFSNAPPQRDRHRNPADNYTNL